MLSNLTEPIEYKSFETNVKEFQVIIIIIIIIISIVIVINFSRILFFYTFNKIFYCDLNILIQNSCLSLTFIKNILLLRYSYVTLEITL
jgi:uncharacterized integral membrane protein